MAEAKKKDVKSSGDFGQSEVKQQFEEATEKGFFGVAVDPIPNSEYSLESGPDSPSIVEQREALKKALVDSDG